MHGRKTGAPPRSLKQKVVQKALFIAIVKDLDLTSKPAISY